ncbi:MAG: DUF4197 family protein [bacterium]
MKKLFSVILCGLLTAPVVSSAGFLDDFLNRLSKPSGKGTDTSTIISGLKEALTIGTDKAVKEVSRVDGYFGNEMIKILMPEDLQKVAAILGKAGFQKQVDDFVLSMNRAAEEAAPRAAPIFVDAIKGMSIADAGKILRGGDTAATDYFKVKTSAKLSEAFKPIISSSMNDVGVTRSYKAMMAKYEVLPFVDRVSIDLDQYVTDKSLEGLFSMVGREEKKIRTDPAARVTDLLKQVFGKEN